jgi:predicted enzyme related to lactoylglutathione lyase
VKGGARHIEIPADNLGAMRGFYGKLFVWAFKRISGGNGDRGYAGPESVPDKLENCNVPGND